MRSFLFLIISVVFGTSALQADPTSHQIHYVGFNSLKADQKATHDKAFRDYIQALKPIMASHGLTLEVFETTHQNAEQPVDYISFGSAPDQASFQRFFDDPAFQALFPVLVGALEHHFVAFTDGPFKPNTEHKSHQLLSVSWLQGDIAQSLKTLNALRVENVNVLERHNVEFVAVRHGVMASTGLADHVEMVPAPNLMEIWQIPDPHTLFDDKAFQNMESDAKQHTQNIRSYWIEPF